MSCGIPMRTRLNHILPSTPQPLVFSAWPLSPPRSIRWACTWTAPSPTPRWVHPGHDLALFCRAAEDEDFCPGPWETKKTQPQAQEYEAWYRRQLLNSASHDPSSYPGHGVSLISHLTPFLLEFSWKRCSPLGRPGGLLAEGFRTSGSSDALSCSLPPLPLSCPIPPAPLSCRRAPASPRTTTPTRSGSSP